MGFGPTPKFAIPDECKRYIELIMENIKAKGTRVVEGESSPMFVEDYVWTEIDDDKWQIAISYDRCPVEEE